MLHVVPAGIVSFPTGYTITHALSFEDGDSAHLLRTPASASAIGGRRTWTFSFWLKRANLGGQAGK